jgi:hypothetical protein
MMVSTRIKLENYNGVLYCDACMDDEFSKGDLEAIRDEIRKNFSSSTDLICKESGCFSVAADVQKMLWEGIEEIINVVYVAENQSKRNNAKYAAETYMVKYNTRVAETKEAAYAMLSHQS